VLEPFHQLAALDALQRRLFVLQLNRHPRPSLRPQSSCRIPDIDTDLSVIVTQTKR
jgi:hypothetical protein